MQGRLLCFSTVASSRPLSRTSAAEMSLKTRLWQLSGKHERHVANTRAWPAPGVSVTEVP